MISSTPAAPNRRDCRDAGARTAGRTSGRILRRKEVIQPHLPVRLPCYDLVPITSLSCRLRSELRPVFRDPLQLALSHPVVPAIVACVKPWT